MTDIENAKKAVIEEGCSVAVFSGGHKIFSSTDAGIKPMYLAYTQGFDFSDADGADKVVGLGAAAFWAAMHIGRLHAVIISDPAYDFLIEHSICVTYDALVPRIKNRDGTGFCPVETLADQSESFESFVQETKGFLEKNNLI